MASKVSKSILLGIAALTLAGLLTAGSALGDGARSTSGGTPPLTLSTVISGAGLSHLLPDGQSEALSQPDDLATLDGKLWVVFQNNLGPAGSPSPSGGLTSTVVEFTPSGRVIGQWEITGHADGLAADQARQRVIVTVNEDAGSSLYTIDPGTTATEQVQHFDYSPTPLAHGGGTDSVSFFDGRLLVSASSPTVADGPALFEADLHDGTAYLTPVFSDDSAATTANIASLGQPTTLALTDPDSNEVVPNTSPRFAGDFVLDSQGDQQQIYLQNLGSGRTPGLRVLDLSQSIDDTAWATDPHGTLYVSDKSAGDVIAVRGSFFPGTAFVAVTPCSANLAPTTCGVGLPTNYLGTLDLFTGAVQAVTLPAGASLEPQGLLFLGAGGENGQGTNEQGEDGQ